jgi:ParB-like chromosome segregation protein Spo0J
VKYETRKPSELSPFDNNARTHTPEQIEKIAASIQEFGFINPIIIDANNGVIAGHARLKAAQSIGLESVPVLRVEHLTEAQKRAYIIADNRLAEIGSDWDVELLQQELADLGDLGLDLELTGFSLDEVGSLLDVSDNESEELKEEEYVESFEVVIECSDESSQQKIYNKLVSEGYTCRVLSL